MVIQLYTASKTLANDDAGTQITKSTLAPVPAKYPYPVPENRPFRHVPSLSLLCLLSFYAACPDQLSLLNGLRLNLRQQNDPSEFDLIQALVPDFDPDSFQSTQLDPRLWVSLAQVYDNLPQVLRTYHIPLSDEHLLLLQRVQSTPTFSLITIVDLTGCVRLTDDTIIQLKQLKSLVALDATSTSVTDNGIKALAGTIFWSEDDASYRGPSSLRILKLRSCKRVTDNVLHIIPRFPLLCLVDLRQTQCRLVHSPFERTTNPCFLDATMSAAIAELTLSQPNLCSSSNVFTLFIDSPEHKPQLHRPPPLSKPETYTLGADQRPKTAPLRGSRNYTPPDVSAVLLEEALLLGVQRRVQSFYQRQATQVLERVKATKTSASTPSPPAPDNFMLYRHPPPWESLFESSTRASFAEPGGAATSLNTESRHRTPLNAKSAVQSKATVNPRKANEMKAALLANWDSTSRTILNSQIGKQPGPSAKPFTPTTRNPFAKQFDGGRTGTDDAQRRHSLPSRPCGTSTLRPPPVPLRDSPRTSVTLSAPTPPKQLKPVSTLSVPLRPQASSSAQKETVSRKINKPHRLIATGTDGIGENGARSNNRRISQDKDSLYAQIDDTLVRYSDRRVEVENTSSSSSAKRLRLRADDPLPPKSTTKSTSTVAPTSKGFNWKGWGNKK